jgi:hypothetical protein
MKSHFRPKKTLERLPGKYGYFTTGSCNFNGIAFNVPKNVLSNGPFPL